MTLLRHVAQCLTQSRCTVASSYYGYFAATGVTGPVPYVPFERSRAAGMSQLAFCQPFTQGSLVFPRLVNEASSPLAHEKLNGARHDLPLEASSSTHCFHGLLSGFEMNLRDRREAQSVCPWIWELVGCHKPWEGVACTSQRGKSTYHA